MRGIIRTAAAAVAAGLIGTTAAAQTLNLGIGVVGSSAKANPGPSSHWFAGVDLPFAERWSVRIEGGRRWPGRRSWSARSQYFLTNPDAPSDPRQAFQVWSSTVVHEDTRGDASILVRYGTPASRRVQAGALAGLDVHALRITAHTIIPRSITDPLDVFEHHTATHRIRGVFDIGMDAGARVDERWTVLAYGIAGLQHPYEEHRRPQLRGGILVKRDF